MENRNKLQEVINNATGIVYKDQSSFYELAERIKDIIEFSRTCGGNAFAYTTQLKNFIESLQRPNLTSKTGFQKKKSKLKEILSSIYCS